MTHTARSVRLDVEIRPAPYRRREWVMLSGGVAHDYRNYRSHTALV
jgi:hypothetical protein